MLYVETLKYGFYVITHPFDGFWGLRRENKGSVAAAATFVVLTILTLTIEKQNTGFLFNFNRLSELNVVVDVVTVALLYALWCVANWCTTSLMDGKGRMQDILTAVGYSLLPIILIRLPMVLMSHGITTNEGSFYYVLGTVSYLWAGFLLFTGTMVIHQYRDSLVNCGCRFRNIAGAITDINFPPIVIVFLNDRITKAGINMTNRGGCC